MINKFDYSIKKQLANEKKIYVLDNGFIPQISNKITKDNGWLLENLVFNNLSEFGKIFYFTSVSECDFVIKDKQKITMAVQVCWELNDRNRERELAGLLKAMNEFKLKEGIIITSNQEEEIRDVKSFIRIIPAWKWLLKN
jgi:predicted AAA+ superfamily ATPase